MENFVVRDSHDVLSEQTLHKVKRISYIDYAKSVCIFLMVVGHWADNDILLTYIYSFHMPALFIISGYLYKAHSWKRTILSFSVPVVVFSLVNLFVQIILGDVNIHNLTPSRVIFGIFHYRYGLCDTLFMGDWFLWALIGLRLLFGDIRLLKVLRENYIILAIACVVYMTFENYLISIDTIFRGYYIGRVIPCLVFFCTGFYMKDNGWSPQKISQRVVFLLMVSFLLLPLLNHAKGINDNDFGLSYLFYAIIAILVTFLLFVLSDKLPSPPPKFIERISKGTLVVLGTHIPILNVLHHVLPNSLDFLFPFVTIVLCYYVILLCERYCPLLLGKWK